MCQIAKLQVANSLMPRAQLPSARVKCLCHPCQVWISGAKNSLLKKTFFSRILFFVKDPNSPIFQRNDNPLPSLPTDMFLGILGVSDFINKIPKINMSVSCLANLETYIVCDGLPGKVYPKVILSQSCNDSGWWAGYKEDKRVDREASANSKQ